MSRKQQHAGRDTARIRALRRQILGGVEMLEEAEVLKLLGPEKADRSWAALTRQGGILRFKVAGAWKYPTFQFDRRNRRIRSSFAAIKAAARAARWSDLRLLSWLMRPHLEFKEVPAATLSSQGDAVLTAFLAEVATQFHG